MYALNNLSFAVLQFEANLLQYVKSLTKDFNTEFWSNGRFLVCTGKQLALRVDGKHFSGVT